MLAHFYRQNLGTRYHGSVRIDHHARQQRSWLLSTNRTGHQKQRERPDCENLKSSHVYLLCPTLLGGKGSLFSHRYNTGAKMWQVSISSKICCEHGQT